VLVAGCVLALAVAGPVRGQEARRDTAEVRAQWLERLRALGERTGRDVVRDTTDTLQVVAGDTLAASPFALTGAAPAVVPADSLARALMGLDGYTATRYEGTGARFAADSGKLVLLGKAQVEREGQTLVADSLLVYDRHTATACGYGKPVLTGAGAAEPVQSEQVCYDIERDLGMARSARTKFSETGNWYVHGDRVYTSGKHVMYTQDGKFTSCDLDEPHYHFAAKHVKIVKDRVMVARDVTLNFADVPVFWLPFLVQSLKQGRQSGLLMPEFSVNEIARPDRGYRRRLRNLGVYWAINDYMGAQVSLDWEAETFTGVRGRFDYNWRNQFLNGNLDVTRYWRPGGTELSLQTSHRWDPSERTSMNVSANFVSDRRFLEENTFDPRELTRTIDSNGGLNHRFDWGNLTLHAKRRQYLGEDRVETTLPSVSLNITPITLFPALPGQARWYSNATWNGNASFNVQGRDVAEQLGGPQTVDTRLTKASASSSFTLGKLSWSQSFNAGEDLRRGKTGVVVGDSVYPDSVVPESRVQRADWSTSLGYMQRLIGTTTLTPSVRFSSELIRGDTAAGGQAVWAPVRMSVGASLKADIFGFWPGVGPFSRIRHRLSPTLSYSYSPKPSVSELQTRVFRGLDQLRESNQLTLSLNQTWEAKYRESAQEGARRDSAAAAAPDTATGPRRLPQARKIKLLSWSMSALAYDFVRAREADSIGRWPGLTTSQLSHTVNSDLLPGLSLSVEQDLFATPRDSTGKALPRTFRPYLRGVTASFSIDNDSWLVRALGLGGRRDAKREEREAEAPDSAAAGGVEERSGLFGGRRQPGAGAPYEGSAGSWNASLNYSLDRPPLFSGYGRSDQLLQANVSFRPTENWSVTWSTGYSFTNRQFSDHYLTLTRNLHRWQANFSFMKAQNGNFSFVFHVNLLDNSDLKLDYEQRGGDAYDGRFRR